MPPSQAARLQYRHLGGWGSWLVEHLLTLSPDHPVPRATAWSIQTGMRIPSRGSASAGTHLHSKEATADDPN